MINLRSDTQTLPTSAMLDAMGKASLGDDTYGEDPTVLRLQDMAAERLGMEAALFVISGHMGNLVALMTHARPGEEVILDADSHINYYETGSIASVAGLMPRAVHSARGRLDPARVRAAIRSDDVHYPRPRLLCLENTHNRAGGRVTPVTVHEELCALAREHGLRIHLDGARIFNAAIAERVEASVYARSVDSLMFCLTKGLSCPLGSLLCGSRGFIDEANRARRALGGGMRQAGVIAAAGIVALETMVDRLANDHARARRLAEGLAGVPALQVDPADVETNMVYVDHSPSGLATERVLDLLRQQGVVASGRPPAHFRLVTNRHHDDATIDDAVARISAALAV